MLLSSKVRDYKNLRNQFFYVHESDNGAAIAMVDVEEKVEYKVERKNDAADEMCNAADKAKAGAKAMGKKLTDPDRDLGTEYIMWRSQKKDSINFLFHYVYIII